MKHVITDFTFYKFSVILSNIFIVRVQKVIYQKCRSSVNFKKIFTDFNYSVDSKFIKIYRTTQMKDQTLSKLKQHQLAESLFLFYLKLKLIIFSSSQGVHYLKTIRKTSWSMNSLNYNQDTERVWAHPALKAVTAEPQLIPLLLHLLQFVFQLLDLLLTQKQQTHMTSSCWDYTGPQRAALTMEMEMESITM